eukprot:1340697-Rhodomonas_salina.1
MLRGGEQAEAEGRRGGEGRRSNATALLRAWRGRRKTLSARSTRAFHTGQIACCAAQWSHSTNSARVPAPACDLVDDVDVDDDGDDDDRCKEEEEDEEEVEACCVPEEEEEEEEDEEEEGVEEEEGACSASCCLELSTDAAAAAAADDDDDAEEEEEEEEDDDEEEEEPAQICSISRSASLTSSATLRSRCFVASMRFAPASTGDDALAISLCQKLRMSFRASVSVSGPVSTSGVMVAPAALRRRERGGGGWTEREEGKGEEKRRREEEGRGGGGRCFSQYFRVRKRKAEEGVLTCAQDLLCLLVCRNTSLVLFHRGCTQLRPVVIHVLLCLRR